jgi:hypothetical protein
MTLAPTTPAAAIAAAIATVWMVRILISFTSVEWSDPLTGWPTTLPPDPWARRS